MMKNKILVVLLCAFCVAALSACAFAYADSQRTTFKEVSDIMATPQEQFKNLYTQDGYEDFDSWNTEILKQKKEFEGIADQIIEQWNEWLSPEQIDQLRESEDYIVNKATSLKDIEEEKAKINNIVTEVENAYQTQQEEQAIIEEEYVDNNYYDDYDYNDYNYDYSYDYSYGYSYDAPSGGLTQQSGVNYYDGRRETYYSSNVLYHYRTSEWTVDNEGFYRDSAGNYVVAASDMAQGTTFEGSKGTCVVLDSGCAAGTTDYYVAW